jgi:hypothetical protein
MIKTQQIRVTLIALVALTLLVSGCEPLRKKFVRQKKKDESASQFIPVLDPVDYPDKVASAPELYQHYFSLWQVWNKELLMRVQEQASDKKITFTFNQVLVQLTAMEKLLTGDKQKALNGYISQLDGIQKELEQPEQIRNTSLIERKLERIDGDLREGFRVKDVQESLVQ